MNLAQTVKMEFPEPLESLEMMEPLEALVTKDHLAIRAVMLPLEIVLHAHHPVLKKDFKATLVCQETQDEQEKLALKGHLVKMESVFLEIVESLVNLVNQVNLDKMVSLVSKVNQAGQEIMLESEKLNGLV